MSTANDTELEIMDGLVETDPSLSDGEDDEEFGDEPLSTEENRTETPAAQQTVERQQTTSGNPPQEQGTQGAQPGQQPTNTTQTQPTGRLKDDGKGNLVDDSGKIIVPAGFARRVYEDREKFRGVVQSQQQQLEAANKQLQEMQIVHGLPQKHGLSLADTQYAIEFMGAFKKDPVATIQNLLTQARAAGYNIPTGEGAESSLDMAAINRMLDEKLAPFTSAANQSNQNTGPSPEVVNEYNGFIAKYPDATAHEDAIAHIMTQTGANAEVAYWQLREWVVSNSLDWNLPLGPQIQARQTQQTQQPAAPMLAGGGSNSAPVQQARELGTPAANQEVLAPASASYDSIIRQAMAEANA